MSTTPWISGKSRCEIAAMVSCPESRPAEDALGQHGAAEQEAKPQADDADDRQQRVAKSMPDHDARPAQAFRVGGAHEVLSQDLDHGGPHEPADDRRGVNAERERRQQEMGEGVEERAGLAGQRRAEGDP